MIYDIGIIGAGVTGALIARTLSKYDLKVCLIEKHTDVAMETSKANSAIIHAGYDAKPGSLKAELNVAGNALMDQVTKELNVPFKRNGSLVLAFTEEDVMEIKTLYENGIKNNVPDMEIINQPRIRELEPNISENVITALYSKSAGIVCPYELTIGAVENAVANGVHLLTNHEVKKITKNQEEFLIETANTNIRCRYIINAAGVYSDEIAKIAEDNSFSINPRKGEYVLLDKNQGNMVKSIIFQTPTKMGKGILVTPTVHGNLLLGPTADNIIDKENTTTTTLGLKKVIEGAKKSIPSLNIREVITSFAGLRATPSNGDFIIRISEKIKGLIHVAGIESPGLTAAPAIAEYVRAILEKEDIELVKKSNYNPHRKAIIKFTAMNDIERHHMIKKNPRYGNIICRCEKVTEGEIVDSINRPVGARTLDAVKRRTRAGMGRCQGGFCTPKVLEILEREMKIPIEEVTKMGGKSKLLVGRTK